MAYKDNYLLQKSVPGLSKTVPESLTHYPKVLGRFTWPLTASHNPCHLNVPYTWIKPSGRKPLPLGVCRNYPTSVSMRSPCREDELFLFLRLKTPIRSSGNLERRWSLSLQLFLSTLVFLSLSPFPSPNLLGEDRSQVRCPLTYHLSTSK